MDNKYCIAIDESGSTDYEAELKALAKKGITVNDLKSDDYLSVLSKNEISNETMYVGFVIIDENNFQKIINEVSKLRIQMQFFEAFHFSNSNFYKANKEIFEKWKEIIKDINYFFYYTKIKKYDYYNYFLEKKNDWYYTSFHHMVFERIKYSLNNLESISKIVFESRNKTIDKKLKKMIYDEREFEKYPNNNNKFHQFKKEQIVFYKKGVSILSCLTEIADFHLWEIKEGWKNNWTKNYIVSNKFKNNSYDKSPGREGYDYINLPYINKRFIDGLYQTKYAKT